MTKLKLGVICDFKEENWPSMELVADKLLSQIQNDSLSEVSAIEIRPEFNKLLSAFPGLKKSGFCFNADRYLNRMRLYPRWIRKSLPDCHYYHVCDHSYSHLLHSLPAERTGVFCHDLDTFRCLLEPAKDSRPAWFKAMAKKILSGFKKAAIVFHTTNAVREEILKFSLISPEKLVQVPLGIDPVFSSSQSTDQTTQRILQENGIGNYVLHVGSCIPRKRIDVLLDVFSKLSKDFPDLSLVQIGGKWSEDHLIRLASMDSAPRVYQLRGLDLPTLASFYRQAKLLLQTSDAEGFGLPVIEALSSGCVVVASDLPVFREIGGEALVYSPVADIDTWHKKCSALLRLSTDAPPLEKRLSQVRRFRWGTYADTIIQAYQSRIKIQP